MSDYRYMTDDELERECARAVEHDVNYERDPNAKRPGDEKDGDNGN